VLLPEQIVFVTELTETVGVGFTVMVVDAQLVLNKPEL
jgi:hypothetical protein